MSSLFVDKRGADARYLVHGEVECGKPTQLEGQEYVGTIAFHGEEGFTEAEASRAPLRLEPILELVCGGLTVQGMTTGGGLPGAELRIAHTGGPRLRLDQNHRGARVSYEAHMTEKEGAVRVNRTVIGRLGGGALHYDPSLSAAAFAAGAPFSGKATYVGRRPPRETRPGEGTWRGDLTVDFPGDADVPLAGPGFSASIVHAKRTETRG